MCVCVCVCVKCVCVCVCECVAHLSCERDGTGLTLGTDARRPGWVALTTWLDLATEVLQRGKLSSSEEEREDFSCCVLSTRSLLSHLHHVPKEIRNDNPWLSAPVFGG